MNFGGQSSASRVVCADQIGPYLRPTITIGPVRYPTEPGEAASKKYVDDHMGGLINYTLPLVYDPITTTLSITDAGAGTSGVITTGAQTIAGDKAFTGTVTFTNPLPPGDNSDKVATTSWVRSTVGGGSGYDSGNGWIGGGEITFVPGGVTFDVSAITCRFTDYTDESNPVAGPVVTFPPHLGVASLHTGTSTVGIYVDSAGAIVQDAGAAWNVPLLYGNKIRLGRLVHRGGTIQAASNSKMPMADRYNLAVVDFVNQLSPLILTQSTVAASLVPPADLSVWISETYVWAQMSNVMVSRVNPSTIYVSDVDRPSMYGIWRDTLGVINSEPASAQLDVHRYNPGATGAALVDIAAGHWVNIPILYGVSVAAFLFQYPTEQFSTLDAALSNVGRFVRLGSSLQPYVVRGYVTVQKDVANLSTAAFSDGEHFNYALGLGSIGGGGAGGGSSSASRQSNTSWVDQNLGDDLTGAVTYMALPYETVNAASAGIVGAAAADPYLVYLNSGNHAEPSAVLLKPFVMVASLTPVATQLEVAVPAPNNVVGIDPSFGPVVGAVGGVSFVTLSGGTGIYIDLLALGGAPPATSLLEFTDMLITGPVDILARGVDDVVRFLNIDFEEGAALHGGTAHVAYCEVDAGKALEFDATAVACLGIVNAVTGHDLIVTNSNSGVVCTVTVTGCKFDGALTLNGLHVTLNIDRASLPTTVNPILNGAVLNILGDLLTQDIVASLNGAAIPLTAANVAVDTATLTSLLGGKVATSTTVNGHALSANVVISASNLTTGTLPHAQLPALVSGDIPNNAASTSGSAAFLSAVSTLPNGTLATTQGSIAVPDNSTKVATTAYVDRLRGANDGVATLDGTGKIPMSQIDVGALGALVYTGTWDIPANLFIYPNPVGLLNGWFYIVSVGGQILSDMVTYAVGDWMVYNGVIWEKVTAVDIGAYLSTWAGSASVVTVGAITTGTWNGDKIDSAYGGAGDIVGPALLKATAGVVSEALADTDYVSVDGDATITGDKDFSGALTTVTQVRTDSSTLVATTAFVQAAANVAQDNVIFLSAVGNDLNDGTTLNNAVLTMTRAVAIAVAGVPALGNKYVIRCLDTKAYGTTGLPNNSYIDFDGSSVEFTGPMLLADYNVVYCRKISTPTVANGVLVHFTGGTNTVSSYFYARRLVAGQIVVDSTQGVRAVDIGYIEGLPLVSSPVITCNAGSTLYVASSKIRGLISAVGTNAVIDLTNVGDLSEATFSVTLDPGCLIRYPPGGAGNVSGLLKGNGAGVISAAVPGTGNDYLKVNDTITLSNDVTGSGSTAIAATIAAGAVTLAKQANLAANSLIGNPTGIAATPTAVSMSAASNPAYVVVRDGDSNLWANHGTEGLTSIPTASGTTSLTKASPTFVVFTGLLPQTVLLPDATTITLGFRFAISNGSTQSITVNDRSSGLVLVQTTGQVVQYMCTGVGSVAGTWNYTKFIQSVSPADMANLAAYSALGNTTGAPAAPAAVSMVSTASASAIAIRDASANVQAKHFTEAYETHAAGLALTVTSPKNQYFTGAGPYIVVLPDATTLTLDFAFLISNTTLGTLTVNKNGGVLALSLPVGNSAWFTCTDIGSAAGTWVTTKLLQVVSTADMSNVAAYSALGNNTGAPAVPAAVSMVSTASVNAIAIRDASANVQAKHFTEAYETHAAGFSLLVTSPKNQYFTGAGPYIVVLPDATTLTLDFAFLISNTTLDTLTVNKNGGVLALSLPVGNSAWFTCTSIGSAAGTWVTTKLLQVVSPSDMSNLAANSVLGNPTGAPAVPSAVAMASAATASAVVVRDGSGNASFARVSASSVVNTGSYTVNGIAPSTKVTVAAPTANEVVTVSASWMTAAATTTVVPIQIDTSVGYTGMVEVDVLATQAAAYGVIRVTHRFTNPIGVASLATYPSIVLYDLDPALSTLTCTLGLSGNDVVVNLYTGTVAAAVYWIVSAKVHWRAISNI